MTATRDIETIVSRELPDFVRAGDLEEVRTVRCYEHAASHRLLRFEFGRPKEHVWLIAFEYESRPTQERILDRAVARADLRSAGFGPLPLGTKQDLSRVARLVAHYARHHALIDWNDPFSTRFLDAFDVTPDDIALARKTIQDRLVQAVLELREDVPKSELTLPLGTLAIEHVGGYVASSGPVPAFAKLVIDAKRKGSPSAWFQVDSVYFVPGFYMSEGARNRLLAEFFDEVQQELDRGKPYDLIPRTADESRSIVIVPDAGQLRLRPSREYVLYLNRGRSAVTQLFATSETWADLYERRHVAGDGATVLTERLRAAPQEFESYKALADHYAAAGDLARSNVVLGLGYLRVRKLPGVARGKLNLAAAADPNAAGLADAFAELDSFGKN